jgi:hypothetical protein
MSKTRSGVALAENAKPFWLRLKAMVFQVCIRCPVVGRYD